MSLSSALSIISSSLTANAAQSSVVSRNVANANTVGYSREVANLLTTSYGGVDVASVIRQASDTLREQASEAGSGAAYHQAILSGLDVLAQTIDDGAAATGSGGAQSPTALISGFRNALQSYAVSPGESTFASQAATAAADLAGSLNQASATVQQVRSQADTQMAQSVSSINVMLKQFQDANNAVVSALAGSGDLASAQDQRDQILSDLSKQIGIATTSQPDGSMSIYTDSGVTLFQGKPRSVAFVATSILSAGASGAAVTVDGVPVTGTASPMRIHSGAMAGYAALRDTIAPQYQAQLDQMAGALIASFAESDQTGGGKPGIAGLFTAGGSTALPASGARTGLAATISVAIDADATAGGNPFLIRDGGIGSSDPAYVYNSGGGAGFGSRIQQLADGLASAQSFGSPGGLLTSGSLGDYANASISWLHSARQDATDRADQSNALATQASEALSNETGVNLDAEMTNMLNLENSYRTTAKLLTTVSAMFSALLEAA